MQYALKQGGMIVAQASGPEDLARAEINHYAAQYAQDGACEIIGPLDDDFCMLCFVRAGAELNCDEDDHD